MESNLRSKPRAAAEAINGQCAMEVELRALRAKVDSAFNEASAAIHSRPAQARGDSVAGARGGIDRRSTLNEAAPGRDRRAERRG